MGDWLAAYAPAGGRGDLYRGASPDMVARWQQVACGLSALSDGQPSAFQEQLTRQVQDLGLTYRLTGDADERDWPLSAMPVLIDAAEWGQIEAALIQRARLMEAVAGDIYGAGRLVADGHVPAALVTGSPYFARSMRGLRPLADHYLHVYAVDLARGPDGQWRILSDRLRLANGVGYALENRLAISRQTGSLLGDVHVRRMSGFFADLRSGIAADCGRENPRIALLSPGLLNQSHAEQAYLARYLGFPLVEGRDLMVQEDRLYLRTIAGPKRIDALWRWLDTNALDPLAFDARSSLGVPDLFGAWARGGLEMANWPGVEVLESRAMAAFLPRLCGVLLNEEPLLPNIATWWCGQPAEAEDVIARIDDLVIASAFGTQAVGLPASGRVVGADLTAAQRAELIAAMRRRPMDYAGQEILQMATTPALVGDALVPRPFTLRAFVARDGHGGWSVMSGGFARLISPDAMPGALLDSGDLSADVWVVDPLPQPRPEAIGDTPSAPIRRGGGILASQTADNLFWFARYGERAEMTLRVLGNLLGSSIEVDGAGEGEAEATNAMVQLLVQWGAIAPDTVGQPLDRLCAAALAEAQLPGGIHALVRRFQTAGLGLRQRFARDFWRIANRALPPIRDTHPQGLMRWTRELLERFGALAGQMAENMVRGPAYDFLDMGRRLERALSICHVTRVLARPGADVDALNALLELCLAQITYRARYLAGAMRLPVLDLVLLDPDNPRSLVYQVERLCDHLAGLPRLRDDNLPERPLRSARGVLALLQSLSVEDIDEARLHEIETRLMTLSETIAARYFLPVERQAATGPEALLA
ncbi:hypothetical protein GTZ99_10260 [Novosphingobium sp. FSY-8]|uniref:Circularly permuted ATP-grasp superfamily protein n=2 Tax=Novosphingobium ovatum TaxID=1908523 RepID=A0ABW9XEG5_9SPHN|nr:hypothetical protein [Novosphingobium ovatum]